MEGKNLGRDDWRGWRFVIISLIVTTASIIFFFAGRHFFPKIKTNVQVTWGVLVHRMSEWGGVRLKTIELSLMSDSDAPEGDSMAAFEPLADKLKQDLSLYYGAPFWTLDLGQVKSRIMQTGWAKSAYLRRSFPDHLVIQVVPKHPAFMVRSEDAWVAVDQEGSVAWISDRIPGEWLKLPVVYGLESLFSRSREIANLERQTLDVRPLLKDLTSLATSLREQVGVDVEYFRVTEDRWNRRGLVTAYFHLAPTKSEVNGKLVQMQVTLESAAWQNRLASLQYVLSDLMAKEASGAKILGQYEGRWIVQQEKPIKQNTKTLKSQAKVSETSKEKGSSVKKTKSSARKRGH